MSTRLAPIIVEGPEERIPLAVRLATIMGALGPVEKKGKITSTGSGPSYKFTRDVDVLHAAVPSMAAAGIVLVPEHFELLSIEPSLSGRQLLANVKASWLVTDGVEEIRFETLGQGADSGDKALPKAQSNARKYAFFMLYHIVTGDDPDHWASDDTPEPRTRGASRVDSRQAHAGVPSSAPVPDLRAELAAAMARHSIDLAALEQIADTLGIPKGEKANDDQLRAMIARIEQPEVSPFAAPVESGQSTDEDSYVSSDGGATSGPASTSEAADSPPAVSGSPTDAEILAAAGEGAELVSEAHEPANAAEPRHERPSEPPQPGSEPYKALPVQEKAAARAYWAQRDAEAKQKPAQIVADLVEGAE